MAKRMLVDATHPEETRVVVVHGNRLEEFDFETASRKQLKGNIYLAKVTRVEPSLQAAFIEYGGNRHGFLAFSEIHPDYFRIPVDDRQQLLAAEETGSPLQSDIEPKEGSEGSDDDAGEDILRDPRDDDDGEFLTAEEFQDTNGDVDSDEGSRAESDAGADETDSVEDGGENGGDDTQENGGSVETVGGDGVDEARERRLARIRRSYKIQEVIKRRQILLVQVTKEERGNKGAALTTFLSLAGRYCVLMPNTPRGGGISRKIANPKDRKRMKAILDELDLPEGMAVILRTAGLERTKTEIRRDLDYLLRLWDSIRETTLKSSAPTLIHEEANLIKRAIRDLYSKDIDEIDVAGEDGYRTAKDFMRMLVPSHAKKVRPYRDEAIPLFQRYQIEAQIDAMHSPTVQLKSGGYIVINPTEALVAIDVNSGRSTRERNIEETAYRTNMEAAEEVARQLRLRDMAGLIVIDFIDMEQDRHNNGVERKLKDSLRFDRARIQVGRISHFGLLEMSRQRLRPSLVETHFDTCPRCEGTGLVRSIGSASLHILRTIEEEGIRQRAAEISVTVPTEIALYLLNEKRDALVAVEQRYGFRVLMRGDDTLIGTDHRLLTTRARGEAEEVLRPAIDATRIKFDDGDEDSAPIVEAEAVDGAEIPGDGEEQQPQRKRRSRRGRRRRDEAPRATEDSAVAAEGSPVDDDAGLSVIADETAPRAEAGQEEAAAEGEQRKKRRRGRRGGRRRSGGDEAAVEAVARSDEAGSYDGDGSALDSVEPAVVSDDVQSIGDLAISDLAATDLAATDLEAGNLEAGNLEPGDLDASHGAIVEDALPEPEPAPAAEKAKPKRKRASRSRASAKKTVADAEILDGPAADVTDGGAPAGDAVVEEVTEKPKRRTRRKPAAKVVKEVPAEEPAADTPAPSVEPEMAPVELAAAMSDQQPEPPANRGNGPADDTDTAVQEIVNQSPDTPRRGWWRRVLDG